MLVLQCFLHRVRKHEKLTGYRSAQHTGLFTKGNLFKDRYQ